MSSLPQGWHGIPVPSKNTMPNSMSASNTMSTTIRKKWNSSLLSEVPHSKLPAYKPSTVRLQKSSINNNLHAKHTSSKPSVLQGNQAAYPVKSPPTKELKNEIAILKKELTTVKTENSILKVKVRRVDDENLQKSKQIEKLRIELKNAQKNESFDSNKYKKSELLLLRQKYLRLEGALKEKDIIIKKLTNEMLLKSDGVAICTQSYVKESSDTADSKQESSSESKSVGKSSSTVRTNLSRASLSSKGEVTKLRDMIHKLEKENQDLQQQVKNKGEEIKRLKLHLRSHTSHKQSESQVPKTASKSSTSSSKSSHTLPEKLKVKETSQTKKTFSSPFFSKMPSSQGSQKKFLKSQENGEKKSDGLRIRKNTFTLQNKQTIPKKQINGKNSKLPVTKPDSTFVISEPISSQSLPIQEYDIDNEVEQMRKNIAAKKIQRSWRSHKKQILHQEPDHIEKAMAFIVSSLRYHKMRKEKLNFVGRQKLVVPKLRDDDESAIVDVIRGVTKNVWDNAS